MNGTIAQLISLAAQANAVCLTGSEPESDYWPGNSSFQFCDWVKFRYPQRRWFKNQQSILETPLEWLTWLKSNGCTGAVIWRGEINDPQISDRNSAGFVGGGGDWILVTRHSGGVDKVWQASWNVWNHDAPENKIWRADYYLTSTGPFPVPEFDLPIQIEELKTTLKSISNFAYRVNCEGFAQCFENSLEWLNGKGKEAYLDDLLSQELYSEMAKSSIKACQAAWVFGGMGSWNDLAFGGEDQKQYLSLSDKCYEQLCKLIIATTNSCHTAVSK